MKTEPTLTNVSSDNPDEFAEQHSPSNSKKQAIDVSSESSKEIKYSSGDSIYDESRVEFRSLK